MNQDILVLMELKLDLVLQRLEHLHHQNVLKYQILTKEILLEAIFIFQLLIMENGNAVIQLELMVVILNHGWKLY